MLGLPIAPQKPPQPHEIVTEFEHPELKQL
jgi:hypothetical protein